MSPEAEFIRSEIPDVRQIVEVEYWLEGERRGMSVDPTDELIQNRVAEIILAGVGARMRQRNHPSTPL